MVNRWAMVKNGSVINVCLWDGQVTTWQPPAGVEMVLAPDHVAIGWGYVDGQWTEPVIPEPVELTENAPQE